ncbi:hypothetical protein AYL99_05500 [Fonsecaea erecta]|uniref:Peptidase C1A papain C-terminal domain-containing protein n=1 Tax=Fonsecaea erecta TaxID=1367422 RepID=A0A178ZL25_9EURO|nr:hypothetical protein AYL99_05500 [Fonsecaea erecta]OAP60498.1 hypothetical protein AYL99_05500 [Fonsecaea erecta]
MTSDLPPGRGAGAKPDPFDGRDRYYVPSPATTAAPSMNLRDKTSMAIYNQGDTNSCTANAAAAAFWFEEKVRGDPTWGSDGPSRAFIYWLARGGWDKSKNYDFSPVEDDGSWLRMAMNGIAKCGACPETECRFPDINTSSEIIKKAINDKPKTPAFNKAEKHTINSYYRLDADRPLEKDEQLSDTEKDKLGADLLQKLKLCLTEGFPVCFTLWFYMSNAQAWNTTSTPYMLNDPWKAGKVKRHTFSHQSGHSVVAVGYDDSKGHVLVQNSWGGSEPGGWGNGLFWMPYSYVTDFYGTVDFWTIRLNKSVTPGAPHVRWEQVNQAILGTA